MQMEVRNYGDNSFNIRREFDSSKRRTRKMIMYFVLTGLAVYLVKAALKINNEILMDFVHGLLTGQDVSVSKAYLVEKIRGAPMVAFLSGGLAIVMEFFKNLRDYVIAYIR